MLNRVYLSKFDFAISAPEMRRMARIKGKQKSSQRANDNEVLVAVMNGATDFEQVARITNQTEEQITAAIHRINLESMQRNGELMINIGDPDYPELPPYKLTDADKPFVSEMVELFSEYMKAATKADGNKAVCQSFELNRIDDMFCGGDSEKFPQANEAIKRMDEYHVALAQKLGEDYQDEHASCDHLGCGTPDCAARAIYEVIYRRLLRKFQIATFTVVCPNID